MQNYRLQCIVHIALIAPRNGRSEISPDQRCPALIRHGKVQAATNAWGFRCLWPDASGRDCHNDWCRYTIKFNHTV